MKNNVIDKINKEYYNKNKREWYKYIFINKIYKYIIHKIYIIKKKDGF